MLRPLARFAPFCRTFACPTILSGARSSAVGVKARLALESLDARVLPATYFWLGTVDTDAINPANWSMTGGPSNVIPGDGDTIIFAQHGTGEGGPVGEGPPPSPPPVVDCDGLVLTSGSFEAMHIQGGYTGTVTFGSALTVGTYSQANGAIAQPQSGYELTVLDTFTWIGGTLNSTSTLSTVRIRGAVGTVDPGVGNTITTGSMLSMESRSVSGNPQGSSTTFLPGTVDFTNSSTIYVDVHSSALANSTAGNVLFTSAAPPPTANIDGTWAVSGGKKNTHPVGLVVSGTVKVEQGSTLDVNSGAAFTSVETNGTGKVVIENGSTLKVSNNVWIKTGGVLNTTVLANQADQRATPAVIEGKLDVSGGSVTLGSGSNPHVWSKLHVKGNGTWDGGTINITIDNNAGALKLDQLLFDGTFSSTVPAQPVAASPKFAITSANALPPAANQVWRRLLEATGGITTTGPIPSAGMGFTIVGQPPENGKVLKWDLQS